MGPDLPAHGAWQRTPNYSWIDRQLEVDRGDRPAHTVPHLSRTRQRLVGVFFPPTERGLFKRDVVEKLFEEHRAAYRHHCDGHLLTAEFGVVAPRVFGTGRVQAGGDGSALGGYGWGRIVLGTDETDRADAEKPSAVESAVRYTDPSIPFRFAPRESKRYAQDENGMLLARVVPEPASALGR